MHEWKYEHVIKKREKKSRNYKCLGNSREGVVNCLHGNQRFEKAKYICL